MARLGAHLATGGAVDAYYIVKEHGVSVETARRDLLRLEAALPLKVEMGVRTMDERLAR
jgi:DeoR/GlpR family transcriptional regulator of sugar metabolism